LVVSAVLAAALETVRCVLVSTTDFWTFESAFFAPLVSTVLPAGLFGVGLSAG
jgi:hypothetical protein